MRRGAVFALGAGTLALAELVAHKLGAQGWLVIPLTLLAAAAGAAAVELGRDWERRRQGSEEHAGRHLESDPDARALLAYLRDLPRATGLQEPARDAAMTGRYGGEAPAPGSPRGAVRRDSSSPGERVRPTRPSPVGHRSAAGGGPVGGVA